MYFQERQQLQYVSTWKDVLPENIHQQWTTFSTSYEINTQGIILHLLPISCHLSKEAWCRQIWPSLLFKVSSNSLTKNDVDKVCKFV